MFDNIVLLGQTDSNQLDNDRSHVSFNTNISLGIDNNGNEKCTIYLSNN